MMLAVASLAIGAVTAMVTPSAHADAHPTGDDTGNTLVNPDEAIADPVAGFDDATSMLNDMDLANTHINSDSTTIHGR